LLHCFLKQNEILKRQLQQQIEFNRIANKVDLTSKYIEELMTKVSKDKEKLLENENLNLKSYNKAEYKLI